MRRSWPRPGPFCAATSPTRTASRIWSPASTIPGTPITGGAGTAAGPAAGSKTPSAPANRPPPACLTRSSAPRPSSCCCAGTARWPWPSSASWPGGPGNGTNSPKPRPGPRLTIRDPPRCRCGTCCCWTGGPRTCTASTSPPHRHPWSARCATCGPNRAPGWTGCSPCWTPCPPRPRPAPPWSWPTGRVNAACTRPGGWPGSTRVSPSSCSPPAARPQRARPSTCCTRSSGRCWWTGRYPRTPGPGWPATGMSATGSATRRRPGTPGR